MNKFGEFFASFFYPFLSYMVTRKRTLLLADAAEIAGLEDGNKKSRDEARERVLDLYEVKDIKEAAGE